MAVGLANHWVGQVLLWSGKHVAQVMLAIAIAVVTAVVLTWLGYSK